MARHEDREVAPRAEAPGCARRPGRAGERGELAVRDDLAARNGTERGRATRQERGLVVELDRHVLERHPLTLEVRLQQPHDFRDEAAIWA